MITQQEARERLSANRDIAVLDVREPQEISAGKIEGAIEVDQVKAQEILQTWPRDHEIIVYCQHGERRLQAARFFQSHGFENIKSLAGGYAAWTASLVRLKDSGERAVGP